MILVYYLPVMVVLSSILEGGFLAIIFHCSLCNSAGVFIHFGGEFGNDCITLFLMLMLLLIL
jgi:hypothetical protein